LTVKTGVGMALPGQTQAGSSFWQLKWHIREELLRQYGGYQLHLVRLSEKAVRHSLKDLVTEQSKLDPLVLDMLVHEAVQEFFTYRPLIKATVLPKERISN